MSDQDGAVVAALHDYAPHPDGSGAMLKMIGVNFVGDTGLTKVLWLAPHEAVALADELLTLAHKAGQESSPDYRQVTDCGLLPRGTCYVLAASAASAVHARDTELV
jgi:hypothetical protein